MKLFLATEKKRRKIYHSFIKGFSLSFLSKIQFRNYFGITIDVFISIEIIKKKKQTQKYYFKIVSIKSNIQLDWSDWVSKWVMIRYGLTLFVYKHIFLHPQFQS